MIIILDYGMGNVKSIRNMFKKIGVDSLITADPKTIQEGEKYILPGVGSFDEGMSNLKKTGIYEVINHEVLVNKKPVLGICLGMQLLSNSSQEGFEKGLCWIDSETIKFNFNNLYKNEKPLPVPHMGWNIIKSQNKSVLMSGLESENRFYFVHSYHVKCNNSADIIATSHYGFDFVCAVNRDNIYGVQFHPEKSHKFGMRLLKNFSDI